jgi:hypothetical protein
LVVHHNNPQWHDNPFSHIKGVTVATDPTLKAHQWRVDGGKVREIGPTVGAMIRKLAMAQAVARVLTVTQATLF